MSSPRCCLQNIRDTGIPVSEGAYATVPEYKTETQSEIQALRNTIQALKPLVSGKLEWTWKADAPAGTNRAQAVVVGEEVYLGGGDMSGDKYQVHQYNLREDKWNTSPGLPRCPVHMFGMVCFMSSLLTVGGQNENSSTNKVYALTNDSQRWEEFLEPMPTARWGLSVAATSTAVIAAGGHATSADFNLKCTTTTVEVYDRGTARWYEADPLPSPCTWMSSVIINSTLYLLGGDESVEYGMNSITACFSVSLPLLMERAITPTSDSGLVWQCAPPVPLKRSTAACLNGLLVTVGGRDDNHHRSSAIHIFLGDSWENLRDGNMHHIRSSCSVTQLSPNKLIVIGGKDEHDGNSKSVFVGSIHSPQ